MRKFEMSFLIIVEEDSVGYHAYVPALKGIHVPGDTKDEAIKNAQDGIVLYMDSILERGAPLPTGHGVTTKPVETIHVRTLQVKTPIKIPPKISANPSFAYQWDSHEQYAAK
ncbi:MAG: type II toxin-antitoxin system HicB family antitoxin [Bacteroidota bacterium]|nr:type II toxin-antitoxin system HicB family antitoxin [Bacteroidota bacterium]